MWHFVRASYAITPAPRPSSPPAALSSSSSPPAPPLHGPGPGSGSGFGSARPLGPQERSHRGGRRFRTEAPGGHVGGRSRDPACRHGRPGSRKGRRLLRVGLSRLVPPGFRPASRSWAASLIGAARGTSDLHVSFAYICIWPTTVTFPSPCQGRPNRQDTFKVSRAPQSLFRKALEGRGHKGRIVGTVARTLLAREPSRPRPRSQGL